MNLWRFLYHRGIEDVCRAVRYRFGEFNLDTARFELSRNGVPIPSEPQVIELLALLVENPERMVSKEEIYERIWRGRIVSEAALSSRIKDARRLLGDDGRTQRFIRTVHRKGFRFAAPVSCSESAAPNSAAEPDVGGEPSAPDVGPAEGAATHAARPAIAVLPFANLSAEPEQEYFSDGITMDIISHLARHRWLSVIARNTTFGFKGRDADARELGRKLEADYVVEGSVRRSGNRVRVSVHLIDTASGHTRWADHYDRELQDIFDVQDDITETIAARLEPEIGYAERNKVMHARPANLQAWDCFHLGIHHFYRFTGDDNREAQRLLRQSQHLDPSFGETFAWWAYAVVLGMVYWDTPPTQSLLNDALAACNQALSLDPHNATFHALRGRVMLARKEYQDAISENRIAIELNPTFAAAHCGLGDSLAYEARYEEAVEHFEKAIALSPNDPQLWAFLTYGALALILHGDYETALHWSERAAAIPNRQYWSMAHRAVALAFLDRPEEARQATESLIQEKPNFSCAFATEKLFFLKKQAQIDHYLEGLRAAGVPERAAAER